MYNDKLNDDDTLNFFSWSTSFDSTVLIDDVVYPNNYNATINFIPKTDNIQKQNIGFEKIKYLLEKLCENAIIFNPKDKTQDFWFKMPVNKILLPGNPYDQLLGVCLFKKIQSISSEYFHFGYFSIDSKLGDRVKYTVDNESFENKHLEVSNWCEDINPWWFRNDTATFDQRISKDKIWTGAVSWEDLGYAGNKDAGKKFKPTVIDGGREK
jgi:hypothetical protein